MYVVQLVPSKGFEKMCICMTTASSEQFLALDSMMVCVLCSQSVSNEFELWLLAGLAKSRTAWNGLSAAPHALKTSDLKVCT